MQCVVALAAYASQAATPTVSAATAKDCLAQDEHGNSRDNDNNHVKQAYG
jgi:hypothetical protein